MPCSMTVDCKKLAWRIFTKDNGITLKMDALKFIEENLARFAAIADEQSVCEALNLILLSFKSQMRSKILQREDVEGILNNLQKNAESIHVLNEGKLTDINVGQYIKIFSAFDLPRFSFCMQTKVFSRISKSASKETEPAFPSWNPQDKIEIFNYRYAVLKDRVLRNEKFSSLSENAHSFLLRTTTHLKGCNESEPQCIFGLLSQLREGVYFLEDPEGRIELDLSEANCSTGIYTENSFIILEGYVKSNGIFKVASLCLPPGEPAVHTKRHYGHVDFLSHESDFMDDIDVLKAMEKRLHDSEIIFIADFQLDDRLVQSKFIQLLDLIETKRAEKLAPVPVLFVLGGPFIHDLPSKFSPKIIELYKEKFESFFDEIATKYSEICRQTTFVIVPSSDDPFATLLLPKPEISFLPVKTGLNVVCTTNPTRIRYFTKEIVVFRDDMMSRMQRNCIVLPNEGKFEEHMAQTILNQAYLSPFPLTTRPINWAHEQALQLTVLPDILVVFDRCDPFIVTHLGCNFANPSSFKSSGFVYLSYYPAHSKAIFQTV